MASYTWDLGIDWDVGTDFDDRYYLQAEFYNDESGKIDTPVSLGSGKTMSFNVWDTTPSGARTQSVESVEVQCKSLYPGQKSSGPFAGSASFKLSASGGFIGRSIPLKTEAPVFNGSPVLTIQNQGRYLLKLVVKAVDQDGKRMTWEVDPEMLVGSGGG